MPVAWTKKAMHDLRKLSPRIGDRIVAKMDWYAGHDNPLSFAARLTDKTFGTYRFRVDDYRVLCDVEHGIVSILFILAVRHRKEAYKRK